MFLRFATGAKRYFLLAALAAFFVAIFDLMNPRIIGFTVDAVIGNAPASLPAPLDLLIGRIGGAAYLRTHLYLIALMVLVFALLAAAMRYLVRVGTQTGTETFIRTMRDMLYGHIIRLPFAWHGVNPTGDIIQRCTSDVETIKSFLSEQLMSLIRILVLVTLSVTFMLSVDVRLTGIAAIYIPVVLTYSIFFHTKIAKQFEYVDSQEGKLSAITQENLTGVRVVRAFGKEKYETERFAAQNDVYANADLHMCRYYSAFWALGDLVMGLQALSVLVSGCVLTVGGAVTVGRFIEFVSYNAMMVWPVRMLGRVIADMSKARVSFRRIRYIMEAEEERDREGVVPHPLTGDIVFDRVSFSYEPKEEGEEAPKVLRDVSFTLPAGKTLGILGGTGSGKSTLAELLDRLYELPEDGGRITVGGTDIRDIPRDVLRNGIGMVLQEPYLFSGTIAENIAITKDSVSKEELDAASGIAQLTETIEGFTAGYETLVGERGVTLSGGQKQRTAIAQMLLRRPPVMVFDDSLSAVDTETDLKIRKALQTETKDATVILISHRISTLMHADRIIVLENGSIAEEGTHEELLAENGIYGRVYALQAQKE